MLSDLLKFTDIPSDSKTSEATSSQCFTIPNKSSYLVGQPYFEMHRLMATLC